jgi:hypothetical protein
MNQTTLISAAKRIKAARMLFFFIPMDFVAALWMFVVPVSAPGFEGMGALPTAEIDGCFETLVPVPPPPVLVPGDEEGFGVVGAPPLISGGIVAPPPTIGVRREGGDVLVDMGAIVVTTVLVPPAGACVLVPAPFGIGVGREGGDVLVDIGVNVVTTVPVPPAGACVLVPPPFGIGGVLWGAGVTLLVTLGIGVVCGTEMFAVLHTSAGIIKSFSIKVKSSLHSTLGGEQ